MMRSRHTVLMLLALSISSAGTASAEGGYVGAKFGPMLIDLSGLDAPINVGVVFGSSSSGGAVEAEITTSMIQTNDNVDVTINTLGVYGVYRSEGEGGFFKIKGGFVHEDVKLESFGGSASGDDSGTSFGIGFGSRGNDRMFEVEYTIIEQDVNFLSLGVFF